VPADRFTAEFIGSPSMNFLRGTVREGEPPCFESESGNCPLTDAVASGQSVELGVRPEAVMLTDGGEGFRGEVVLVEPLGPETLVHVKLPSATWVVRCTDVQPAYGDQVSLSVRPGAFHLFDPASGERI